MKTVKMPVGVEESYGGRRISVVLDKEVFDGVCAFGLSRGWSFSQAANHLTKRGLKAADEAAMSASVKVAAR